MKNDLSNQMKIVRITDNVFRSDQRIDNVSELHQRCASIFSESILLDLSERRRRVQRLSFEAQATCQTDDRSSDDQRSLSES